MGDILSRFGSLEKMQEAFTASLVGALMDSIMVIGVLIMMILYGGHLTWYVIGFTMIYIFIRLLTYSTYRQLSEENLIKGARVESYFMETLLQHSDSENARVSRA
jgi:colicin V processing peptidase. Cysteine peptidase. MEROPS family C39